MSVFLDLLNLDLKKGIGVIQWENIHYLLGFSHLNYIEFPIKWEKFSFLIKKVPSKYHNNQIVLFLWVTCLKKIFSYFFPTQT